MPVSVRALLGTTGRRATSAAMLASAVTMGLAPGGTSAAWGAPADYALQYIERMPIQTPSSSVGVVPYAIVPAFSSDGEWLYYHAPCAVFPGTSTVTPGCPTLSGNPDYTIHARRVRLDGTDEECLTCGASNTDFFFGRHSGSPEPHGDYVLFTAERYRSSVVTASYEDSYETLEIDLPAVNCGAGVTAPGGGWWHDLYVGQISTGDVTLLHTTVAQPPSTPGTWDDIPGLLDPRWSDDGVHVLWSERQKQGTGNSNLLGDWRIRLAAFATPHTGYAAPHLHGYSGTPDATAPSTIDTGPEGTRITGGFARDSGGSLATIYFGGSTAGTSQWATDNDMAVVDLATGTTHTDLTRSSGVGGESGEYEEHAHLNQKYWDAFLWMSSEGYGSPDPEEECFLSTLETDLWMMPPAGVGASRTDKIKISKYNETGVNWEGQNPDDHQTIVSKLQWAPNGVDAAVSVNFVLPDGSDPDSLPDFDNHIAIYHFRRFQNPAADSGSGFETNASSTYADGGGYASNIDGANQVHDLWNVGISMPRTIDPGDIVIDGIEVRLDWWTDSTSSSPYMGAKLSWDGGTNWTDWKTTTVGATSQRTDILGTSSAWTVGGTPRTFTAGELSNANFRIKLATACTPMPSCASAGRDYYLDWASVRVTYHVP